MSASDSDLDWERRHWQRIEQLFEAADELPEADRGAFLDEACDGDQRLRDRVVALLDAELETADEVGQLVAEVSPFARAAAGEPEDLDEPWNEPAPDRIGPYEVLREVGRGGSSSVYLAERADGVFRKQVALKLVRRGVDTQDLLRRLHQERAILARLDHPNIARLLDGGSLPDGRPYLVMEYAEGQAIDEHCRRQSLDVGRRLELFIEVCRAVHVAHQNLTIHRDIKASNILVTEAGEPKLLDFGIAKVLEEAEGLTNWQITGTRAGVRYMTPAYASPEQIRGEALSTATDIYSLGVLLHRLLTGLPPYELDGFHFGQLEPAVTAPPKPSQHVSAESMEAMGLAPSHLRRHRAALAGDLDTIVAMTLRAEPERRYGSAEQLADDIQRHLDGLPVRAQPDRWGYRTKKFARRHAKTLIAAGIVAGLLATVVTFFSLRLIEERNRAFQASTRAELESSKSAQVTDFLQKIFEVSNPSRSLGESVTAVQLLDRGADQIEAELAAEPEIQASLMAAIAQSYAGLGLYDKAEVQLRRSFALRQSLFDEPHESLAEAHQLLGNLCSSQGRYDEAQQHFAAAVHQRRQLFGPDDSRTVESEGDVGAMAHVLGRLDEAEALYRRARASLRADPGPLDEATLMLESNLVTLLYDQRRLEEAAKLGRSVYERQRETLGERHPDTVATEATLAAILVADGRHEEAEPLLRELWQRRILLLGEAHPDVALAANNLAAVLFYLDRFEEAEPLYLRALAIQKEAHGPGHQKTISTMLNLADVLVAGRQDDDAARPLYQEAITRRRQLVPAMSLELVRPLISLGRLELRADRPESARRQFEEAVSILAQDQSTEVPLRPPWRLAHAQSLFGEALARSGHAELARPRLEEAVKVLRAELGEQHRHTQRALERLERFDDRGAGQ